MPPAASPTKVNLTEKFARFDDHWAPRIAARYNGNEIRLAKASGDFQWHSHPDTDELFIVIEGTLRMEFRDRVETLEHFPQVPEGEAKLIIIDPADTANTGDPATAFTPTEV